MMKVKELLSDFVYLIYPKPEGEEWKWGEIIAVIGMIVLLIIVIVMTTN